MAKTLGYARATPASTRTVQFIEVGDTRELGDILNDIIVQDETNYQNGLRTREVFMPTILWDALIHHYGGPDVAWLQYGPDNEDMINFIPVTHRTDLDYVVLVAAEYRD